MTSGQKILFYFTHSTLGAYFLFLGISQAQGFLATFFTAVILALMVVPISRKMEEKKIKRGFSSFLSTLVVVLLSLAFVTLFSLQMRSIVNDWPQIMETMQPKIADLKNFVFDHTPMNQRDWENSSLRSGIPFLDRSAGIAQEAANFFTGTMGFLGTYLLTFVYIFFLLCYRHHIMQFLLLLFPNKKQEKIRSIIGKSARVSQQYLVGKLIIIVLLAIIYSIGFGISGVNNFILISAISAFFTLIPYVGNIFVLLLAISFGYLSSGSTSVLTGIIITFTIAQFVESYVLQPYVVGDKVDLHPLSVIVVVIIGNSLWGIIGMILAIPLLAILTVIFLNVKPLYPFGFLLSNRNLPDKTE